MKTMHRLIRVLLVCGAGLLAVSARAGSIEYVSGNYQAALVGSFYAQPWVVRVAPFEVVRFGSFRQGEVTFEGTDPYWVTADEAGIATSPLPRAGAVAGQGLGYAMGSGSGWVFFDYVNLSPGLTAVLTPLRHWSIPIGYTLPLPFQGRVLRADGRPAANVRYAFSTDPACGAFEGAASVEGVTGEDGTAPAPPFTALGQYTFCAFVFTAEGAVSSPDVLRIYMHEYPIEAVAVTVYPNAVTSVTEQEFSLEVRFAADGQPIAVPPGFAIQVTTAKTGATAVVSREPIRDTFSERLYLSLMPNHMPGTYEVLFTVGPNTVRVPVTQRKPRGP
jgi:hypothetical protein